MWVKSNWLTRLSDVKAKLSLTTTAHDVSLSRLLTQASAFVQKQTMRVLKPKAYTEYLDGGVHTLVLKEYPVIEVTGLYVDPLKEFGSSTKLDTESYVWYADGRISLVDLGSRFVKGHKVIKVEYKAGYSAHLIVENAFSIELSDTTQHEASITPGEYDIWSLCSVVAQALNDLDIGTFTVEFDDTLQRVTVASDVEFKPVVGSSVWDELGFTQDVQYAVTHYSDSAVVGVPHDLRQAVEELVIFKYEAIGTGKIGYRSESRGDQSLQFDFSTIPFDIREVIDSYTRRRIG